MPIKHITVNEDKTKLNRIREYLEVMKDEPEGYIKMSEIGRAHV